MARAVPALGSNGRQRRTPFSEGVEAQGVTAYTVYNHMLLPAIFESPEADYHHLKQHVQIWDVACERQVELRGADAARLMQMLTPRDLSKMQDDQCYYVPVVEDKGGMLNDPVAIKHSDDHWWVSVADSDLILWIKGLAVGRGLDVSICEPDVSPLAIQGPKSEEMMARLFGDTIRDLGFFRYGRFGFDGRDFLVARSGYSKQGGFEIYLEGSENGMPLWQAFFERGADLNLRAGGPNTIERVEGGLLSFGADMTNANNPYECGLGKFCQPERVPDCVGADALKRIAKAGPERKICAVAIEGAPLPLCGGGWGVYADGMRVGMINSAAYSPDFETNVSIAMIERSHWESKSRLDVDTPDGMRPARLRDKFWK